MQPKPKEKMFKMFSHLHSTAVAVNEAKCGEGISSALLLNCVSLILFQSGSNQVRTAAACMDATLRENH